MTPCRIIVVDDDPFIREVLGTALGTRPGIAVCACATVAAAVAAARRDPPDMIVLDLHMPGEDGRAAYRALRGVIAPMPPVVFLTAQEDVDVIATLLAEGAAGVLAKPFDPTVIAAEILRFAPGAAPPSRDRRLDHVAAAFRASLATTMTDIDRDWNALRRDWQPAVAEALLMRVHKLAGAAGLFKFGTFGKAARDVEALVRTGLDAAPSAHTVQMSALEDAMRALWSAALEVVPDV